MDENPEVHSVKSTKKRGQNPQKDDEATPSKKVKLFSAKDFRKELNTADKNTALGNFLKSLENDQDHDCALAFLESGGSCVEILQTMENDPNVPPLLIFEIVNHILLRIGAKHHKYQIAAHESCKYLLNTYVPQINKMLGLSSSTMERVVALKLLTTIVTFSAVLAKDVLIHVNFNPTNLDLLTKIIDGKNEVRKAFLHFLTAFLVDGHYQTLSILLDRKGFLTSVVNGLKFDKDEVVVIFLTALKNHVLENPSVSKTVKMKTFSTPVVRDIVNLYNWKGPRGVQTNNNKKRMKTTVIVDEVAKSRVSEAVHAFLLVLCTCHKFGVIFHDHSMGLGKKNQNSLMYTVLESLDRPWEHSYAGELVLKIIGACPDLAKTMWSNLCPILEPRPTSKWLKAMEFASKLLEELRPSCLDVCVKELTTQQVAQIIWMLILPLPVIKAITCTKTKIVTVRFHVTSLLLKMVESVVGFIDRAHSTWSNIDRSSLSSLLSAHVTRHFPEAKVILNDLNRKDANANDFEAHLNQSEILQVAFDLFKSYQILSPRLLDSLTLDLEIMQFLEQTRQVTSDFRLEIKIVSFFLDLEPSLFSAKTPLFQSVFGRILESYYDGREKEVSDFLQRLLINLGIFDNFEIETGIWIDAITNLKKYDSEIGQFLVEIIKGTESNLPEISKNSKLSPLVQTLSSVEDIPNSKNMKAYLKFLLLNLYHLQQDSSEFLEILTKIKISSDLQDYVNNWEQGISCTIKSKGCAILDKFVTFSDEILSNQFNTFDNLVGYPDLKLNLLQMSMFYLSKLVQHGNLDIKFTSNFKKAISSLINDEKSLQDSRFFAVLFENRTIISNLTLTKSGDLLTPLIVEIVKELKSSGYDLQIEPYLSSFRMKIVSNFMKILKKPKKTIGQDFSLDLFETFQLNYDQCCKLLSKIVQVDDQSLSVAFHPIVSYCLDRLAILCVDYNLEPLSDEITSGLASYLSQVIEVPQFNRLASSFLNYLKIFPHSVDLITSELFSKLLSLKEFHKDNLKLCEFLLLRKPEFLQVIEENLDDFCEKKGFVLSLLQTVISISSDDLLEKIHGKLESTLQKTLQKPHKASQHFHNFYKSVGYLIDKFTKNPKLGNQILKFEASEVFHAFLLRQSFRKVDDKTEKMWTNMIMTFVHLLINPLKKFDQVEKIHEIAQIFLEFLDDCPNLELPDLKKSDTFGLFSKLCLKYGISDDDILLRVLKRLAELSPLDEENAKLLLEMMLAHSQFLDAVLGDRDKEALLDLWLLLCTTWPLLMERSHVPVLLSAYNGTRRKSDQLNLKLLQMYESKPSQTNFFDFKPFLWGKAAASYYSVRSNAQKVLWRQPKVGDVLDNLHENAVLSTIVNPDNENSYDLKFFLPLFGYLLAAENHVHTYHFTKTGALSLTIAAFCNEDRTLRLIACHVLSRFRFHLDAKLHGKDTLLWQRFMSALCKGVATSEGYKLNHFSTVYLSKMALIMTQPTHVMYAPLTLYLSSKNDLDFGSIPELYTLLHGNEVEFKEHRAFILQVIKDGLRSDKDVSIFLRSMGFKLVSELCSSSLCDLDTKSLILDVFDACISVQLGLRILCGNLSFLTQIHNLLLASFETDADKEVAVIVSKILNILKKIVDFDRTKPRNFSIYLSVLSILENDKVFSIMKSRQADCCFYQILEVLVVRYPDFFGSNDKYVNLLLKRTKNNYCYYVKSHGSTKSLKDEDFGLCPGSEKDLRSVFYKLLNC